MPLVAGAFAQQLHVLAWIRSTLCFTAKCLACMINGVAAVLIYNGS
jgi:hypothetical protein